MILKLTQLSKVITPILVAIMIIIGGGIGHELGGTYLIHSETIKITLKSDQTEYSFNLPILLQVNITATIENTGALNFTLTHWILDFGREKHFSIPPGASLSGENDSFFLPGVSRIILNFLPDFDNEDSKYELDVVIQGRSFTLMEILALKEYDVIERILILSVFGGLSLVLITISFVIAITINIHLEKKKKGRSYYTKYRFSSWIFSGLFFIQQAFLFNLVFQPLKIQIFSVGEIQIHKPIFPRTLSFLFSGLLLILYGLLHYRSMFDGSS